ncbi:MAG: zinc ribbon domain-containing protein [Chloroflexi bacterium]|nr:zinc ribbon domain-containing protein [Chloroflexota bacterium]
MSSDFSDLKNGLYVLLAVFLIGYVSRELASLISAGATFYYGFTGIRLLISKGEGHTASSKVRISTTASSATAPTPSSPTIADRIKSINAKGEFKCPSCGATVNPTETKCRFCGSVLANPEAENIPRPLMWADIEIGQTLQINHPQKGATTSAVDQRIYYGELWQERMTPNTPWTLTGNYFAGLHLKNGIYLLNWQSRYFLLDSHLPLTDQDIQRDLATPAREFASSNQTAKVLFEYKGTKWKMDDIGRFRIELADGESQKLIPGAVGRFIHASQAENVLVVEDFQSGGSGLDIARLGFKIELKDVKY